MNSLIKFHTDTFIDALKAFFEELKVPVDYLADDPASAADVLGERFKATNEAHKLIDDVYALGMVNDAIFEGTATFKNLAQIKKLTADYDGLLLLGISLKTRPDGLLPTRSQLAEITRVFNRTFPYTPVTIVFKYDNLISFANSERIKYKQEWREGEKVGKVIIVQDVDTINPHTGHLKILMELPKPKNAGNYKELLNHWNQVLDVSILNKKFFSDLSNWYFWAMDNVQFPDDLEKKKDVLNATNLIRLITRIIFIWFIKEKSLVPNALFNKSHLDKILKDFNKNTKSRNYYHAILQNLFFGTLNQKMEERKFAKEGDIQTNKDEYGVKNLFRYADLFNIPEKEVLALFKDVPFLNGGLFDCLDKPNEENKIVYVDGFSRNPKKQAVVPDYIFFGEEREVDLNDIYATKNKKYKSRGLINLLDSYKFTVAENTPIEEEIALDPELLGKVFENLLASYNPETQTTARKQTGSFYTPREIVNYMVDESLLEYIKQNVKNDDSDFETRLRELISYSETPNPFDEAETKALIEAINNCKILDPACGSGAYPMGILHKMVHLLQKLDPENRYWKALQRQKAMEETEATFKIGDKEERGKRLAEINDVFENNASDYGRKLYLIENCIYGIDIQPIAVQISKLRFFISLIIDQNKQATKENFGIRSLPNLETKFVAANTLIGLDKPAQTLLRNPEIEVKENQLKELRHKYFTANTRKEKLQYQKQDKKLRQEIAKMLESDGWQTTVSKQIVAFDPYDQNTYAPWFDPEWMFGLTKGFDIVIGNPPYVEAKKLKEVSQILRKHYYTYSGTADLYVYFYEHGIRLLKNNGTLVFITSNKFIKTSYGENLRKYFTDFKINEIIDFTAVHVFEALVASCIFSISKNRINDNKIKIAFANDTLTAFTDVADFVKQNKFHLSQNGLSDKIWQLENETKLALKEKIENGSITLNQTGTVKIYRGVTTGYNPAFIIDDGKRKQLIIEDKNNKSIIKPMLQGRNIRKWVYNKTSGFLIFTRKGIDIKEFPSIKKHLLHFKQQLEPGVGRKAGNYNWYEIQDNTAYYPEFEKEKIIWGLTSDKWTFAYDNEKNFLPSNGYILTSSEIPIKYLLALLNSKIMEFYFGYIGIMTAGGAFTLKYETVIEFPIKKISTIEQKIYITLVDYILLNKKEGVDTSFFERLIDAMVYELYLPEEIKAGGAEVLKHLNVTLSGVEVLPELKEGQDEKNLKIIEKVYKELSDPKHPISAALLKLLTIEEVNIIEGRK